MQEFKNLNKAITFFFNNTMILILETLKQRAIAT